MDPTHQEYPLLDCLLDHELENVYITGLSEAMGAIKGLVLSNRDLVESLRGFELRTSRAGFHHISVKMTLLQAVKLSPAATIDPTLNIFGRKSHLYYQP
jgi:hypothetical protein